MKTNQKQLKLIQYGLKPSTVSSLNESQVNTLYKKLLESNKKETEEQTQVVTQVFDSKDKTQMSKLNQMLKDTTKLQGQNIQVKETEVVEDDTEIDVANASKGMYTQNKIQEPSPDGTDDDRALEEEYKRLMEKFESKKQQKYFFAKCGDGKTKEQKKWCKMADEFASKTNFKKLPEKKKEETKESGMSNYTKKVASAFAGGLKSKLNNTLNPTMGESELEKQVLRLVEKHITPKMTKKEFLNLVREQGGPAPVKPDVDTPTRPKVPATPYRPKPGIKTAPKAGREAPVKPDVDTPTRPKVPATPYKPKPGIKPAPKAGRKRVPNWLSFDEIGINLK